MPDIPSRLNASLEGRYKVLRELGAGGMATVYLVRDLRHERDVALKVLHPHLSAVIGSERFLGEIRTTAALQHPHILPLFDSGEADGLLFYVMPYVAGESLRDRLDREKQLAVDEAVALVAKVADALEHAHRRGVVHRDIKPANILLSEGGEPVVADFGIALALSHSGDRRVTETGLSLGTPDYMSPEQAAGERDLGPRSDLYALGCVLYELLTGQPPFTASTPTAVISRILTATPEPPSAHRRSVPAHVDSVVMRALEKLPADRFSSASDMARALHDQSFRHALPDAAGIGSAAPATRRWRYIAAATTVLALVLLARDLTRTGSGRTADETGSAVRRSTVMLPDSLSLALVGATPLGVGMKAFDVSPDGGLLAFVGTANGTARIHVRDMASGAVTTLAGTENAYAPFWSPDGAWIGYFAEGSAFKVAADGGAPIPLVDVELPYGGAWLPDGRIVMATGEGRSLVAVPSDGGRVDTLRHLPDSRAERLVFPELLPEGREVLLSSPQYQIVRFEVATGHERILTRRGWIAGGSGAPPVDPGDLIRGTNPRALRGGHILFISPTGSLMSVRMPGGSGDDPGEPVQVLDDVRSETVWGAGQWDVSADGTLYYVRGEAALRTFLVWRNPSGAVDTLSAFGRANWGALDLSPSGVRVLVVQCSVRGECGDQVLGLREGLARSALVSDDALLGWSAWYDDDRLAYLGKTSEGTPLTVLVRADNADARDSIAGFWVRDVSRDELVLAQDSTGRFVVGRAGTFPDDLRVTDVRAPGAWGLTLREGGGWFAYTSGVMENGEWQVYLVRTEPPWDRIRVSPRGGEEPVWHPNGNLIYREDTRWMSVSVPDGPGAPGVPRLLFEGPYVNVLGRSHDVDPSGRHLLIEAPGEMTAGRIEMVSGWVSALPGGRR